MDLGEILDRLARLARPDTPAAQWQAHADELQAFRRRLDRFSDRFGPVLRHV